MQDKSSEFYLPAASIGGVPDRAEEFAQRLTDRHGRVLIPIRNRR